MLRVALTGGIATGKTYCLGRFSTLGLPVVDADQLARSAVEAGSPALFAIARRFGPGVVSKSGALDRPALAAIVFADERARRDLEGIVHPEVYRRITAWARELEATGRHPVAIADIPLLFETGHEHEFDRVVVVACAPETQLTRLRARDGMSEAEARRRLAAQWPIARKVERASYVIRTDGTFEDTDAQVDRIHNALLGEAGHRGQRTED